MHARHLRERFTRRRRLRAIRRRSSSRGLEWREHPHWEERWDLHYLACCHDKCRRLTRGTPSSLVTPVPTHCDQSIFRLQCLVPTRQLCLVPPGIPTDSPCTRVPAVYRAAVQTKGPGEIAPMAGGEVEERRAERAAAERAVVERAATEQAAAMVPAVPRLAAHTVAYRLRRSAASLTYQETSWHSRRSRQETTRLPGRRECYAAVPPPTNPPTRLMQPYSLRGLWSGHQRWNNWEVA